MSNAYNDRNTLTKCLSVQSLVGRTSKIFRFSATYKLLYKGISNSPKDRYQNITEIHTALNNMRFEPKEINPFDDMQTFSYIVRSTVPEFFNDIAYTDNKDDINSILLKFYIAKTNRPFEFNTGTSNNTIDNIAILENGNILINWHELNIAGMWGCLSNDTYNDILILETLPVKPYTINGQEEWAVAIIEDSHIIPIREIESGFVRYNGKVVPTSELNIQERYLYPEDLHQRYYAIGAFAHCSIIQKNDCYLDSLQEKKKLTREDIKNYRKQISHNNQKNFICIYNFRSKLEVTPKIKSTGLSSKVCKFF